MKLPVDEEHDEKMVGVPELFKVGTTALFHRVPDHNSERSGHDPPGDEGAGNEVGDNELFHPRAGGHVGNLQN